MSVKIQINSLPALLHLLESEEDQAVEIKRSVLKEYEIKHVLPAVLARLEKVVGAEVAKNLFKNPRVYKPELTREAAAKLNDAASQGVRASIQESIDTAMKTWTPERINALIEMQVKEYSFYAVREQVKTKIKEALDNE